MLGIYFAILLLFFILLIVGAVIGYSQSLEEIKKPLEDSMNLYDPDKTDDKQAKAVVKAWDKVQSDVSIFEIFSQYCSV